MQGRFVEQLSAISHRDPSIPGVARPPHLTTVVRRTITAAARRRVAPSPPPDYDEERGLIMPSRSLSLAVALVLAVSSHASLLPSLRSRDMNKATDAMNTLFRTADDAEIVSLLDDHSPYLSFCGAAIFSADRYSAEWLFDQRAFAERRGAEIGDVALYLILARGAGDLYFGSTYEPDGSADAIEEVFAETRALLTRRKEIDRDAFLDVQRILNSHAVTFGRVPGRPSASFLDPDDLCHRLISPN
jgi:hypothetical protein